jgi:intracellular septation protein A
MNMLLHSARALIADLASTLAFLVLILVTGNPTLAVAGGMALGVGQIGWLLARRRPVDLMQWMSLVLVLGFGTASLMTHDPRFVMLKPSLIYLVVGGVMMRPGWMLRYMPPIAVEMVPDLAVAFGFVWAGLMFVSAGLNLVLATRLSPAAWAGFMSSWGVVSKGGLFAMQFVVMRAVGRRRARRQAALAPAPAQA